MCRSWTCRFFFFTFIWSWSLWLIPIMAGLNAPLAYIFYALGGIAPSSVGIILACLKKDQAYHHNFRRRICSFRLINIKSYVFIILFMFAVNALAVTAGWLTTGNKPNLATLLHYIENPASLLLLAVYMLLLGPVAEEIGWRGFALDHLLKKHSWVTAGIILGLFWALWHIPLFFIAGTYQYSLLQESLIYLIDFLLDFFPASIIMAWLYKINNKSILSAILFHFSINFYGELINIPNYIKPYRTLALLVFTIIILIITYYQDKKRQAVPCKHTVC